MRAFELKEELKKLLAAKKIDVEDVGCFSKESVDYPDYGCDVARKVSEGLVDQGILVCNTGIGMSIAANKFPRVRAALCMNAAHGADGPRAQQRERPGAGQRGGRRARRPRRSSTRG